MFTALFIPSDYNKFYLYPFVQNKNIKLEDEHNLQVLLDFLIDNQILFYLYISP